MEFIRGRRVQSWLGSDLWVGRSEACELKRSNFGWGSSQHSESRMCWLKSKRPANSLSRIALPWPLELLMGYASLNGAER